MIRILLITLLLYGILAPPTQGQGTIHISGEFPQATTDSVYLCVQYHYISYLPEVSAALLSKDGKFHLERQLEQPVIATLHVGNQQVPLFLHPWDSLYLRSRGNNLLTDLSFEGLGESENERLQAYRRTFLLEEQLYPKAYREDDPDDFLRRLDKRDRKIEKWLRDTKQNYPVSPDFLEYLDLRRTYEYGQQLLNYGRYRQYTDLEPLPEPDFYDELKSLPRYAPEAISRVYAYTDFLMGHLGREVGRQQYDATYFRELYDLARQELTGEVKKYLLAHILAQSWERGHASALLDRYTDYQEIYTRSPYRKTLDYLYKHRQRTQTGAKAPDFSLVDAAGNTHRLDDWKGKYVVLLFWQTNCSSCIADLERIERLSHTLEGEELAFVFVALDTDASAWRIFVQRRSPNGTHLRTSGRFSRVARNYQLTQLPTLFLIAPDGTIADYPGRPGEGLRQRLQALFE